MNEAKCRRKQEQEEEGSTEEQEEGEEQLGIFVPRNIWIIKPGENSNRGTGIRVVSTLREVTQEINSYGHSGHTCII